MVQKVSNYKTAAAYAEAWFEVSADKRAEDIVFEEVNVLLKGIENIDVLWNNMSSPIVDETTKLSILEDMVKKAKLSKITSDTLNLIASNGRLELLPLILKEFIKLYHLNKGIIDIEVESAISLTPQQESKLQTVLEKKLKKDVAINYLLNPNVLGGLKISFDSYLIDDTVQTKLNQIKRLLEK